jgi:hypothetical protein
MPMGPGQNVQALAGQAGINTQMVPPGPAPTASAPSQPQPVQPQQQQAGPQQNTVPAPNRDGFLTLEEAQILQAVSQNPRLVETLQNIIQAGQQQAAQQAQAAPGAQQAQAARALGL